MLHADNPEALGRALTIGNHLDKDISILYLPSTPYLSSGSGPRLETLTKRLQDIKKDKERNIIVGQ